MRMKYIGLLMFGLMVWPVSAQSDFDPMGEHAESLLPKIIRTQVEYIEVPQEVMVDLMYGENKSVDDTKLRDELQKLLKKGEATMLESQMVVSRSGERATSESIKEYIYPTEFEPSEVPNKVNVDGEETGEKLKDLATRPTPTTFETRNLGNTLEVEPILGETGAIIDLTLRPEIVWHVKNEVWAEWRDHRGNSDIKMPTMYTLRMNTSVTVKKGEYRLVAAMSPKDDKGFPDPKRKVMVFVKADVLVVGR